MVEPSAEMDTPPSSYELLIGAPKCTGSDQVSEIVDRLDTNISPQPNPEGRSGNQSDKKNIKPSALMSDIHSLYCEQIGDPRFSAGPQSSSTVWRRATQKSSVPKPPGRSEQKYSTSPSAETVGTASPDGPLTFGPKFLGSPHSSSGVALVVT